MTRLHHRQDDLRPRMLGQAIRCLRLDAAVARTELQPKIPSQFVRSVHCMKVGVATTDALDRRKWQHY